MDKNDKAEEGIREALIDLVKRAELAIKRFCNLDLTPRTVQDAEHKYAEISAAAPGPDGRPRERTSVPCHFDAHSYGCFTCLKVICQPPWSEREERSRVLTCEPLDTATLLASRQWMDSVFELFGENIDTCEPFALGMLHIFAYKPPLPHVFCARSLT